MTRLRILPLLLALCLVLSACGGNSSTPAQEDPADTGQSSADTDSSGADGMFTARDLRVDYDEEKAAAITLTGSGGHCASSAVSLSGSTVTVLDEGTYIFTGSLTGQIVVDAPEDAKVQLVLRGVTVHSESSAALYVKQADKVVVTLEGESALSCGDSFTAIDENNIDGAVYAKSDLTFNGSGSLTVTSPGGHGIVGKDDVVFAGGSYVITSSGHGIDANDSVRCRAANFTVSAGKDAIHAENSDDAALGFVYVESGSFALEAQGDGISGSAAVQLLDGSYNVRCGGGSENGEKQSSDNWGGFGGGMMPGGGMGGHGGKGPGGVAFNTVTAADTAEDATSMKGIKAGTDLTISGGTYTIDSADDGLHSNGSLTVTGGSITIATDDDGLHAEEELTVTDGAVTVTESYEGLEGLHIVISGGKITLTSSDDGINAAGGTDQSGAGGRDQFAPGGMGGMSSGNGSILISGGEIYMNASGDGIDANGSLEIIGGFTVVCGPMQGDTAVLDYDTTAAITGGTFIGTGSTMMAQTFTSSTQGVFAVTCGTQPAGTNILLRDSSGSAVIDYTPTLPFGLVILSTPEMVSGDAYTVTVGELSGTFKAA